MDSRNENTSDQEEQNQRFVLTKSYRPDPDKPVEFISDPRLYRHIRTDVENLRFDPTAQMWFFSPDPQAKACNYINHILNKNLMEQTITTSDLDLFPSGFGDEFIIGPEVKKPSESDKNRYYHLFFIDDIDHPSLTLRGVKNGILQVNSKGCLSILDKNFHPMNTNSSFIFENNELKLYLNDWLKRSKRLEQDNSWCNII